MSSHFVASVRSDQGITWVAGDTLDLITASPVYTVVSAWQIDGAETGGEAHGALLAYLADQYTPHTITRIIPREPTNDERIEAARRVLRADYWQDVRNVVDSLKAEIGRGNITDTDAASEWLDETVDGHQRVIYTAQAIEGLLYTDNESAYVDEMGEPPPSSSFEDNSAWSVLMYYAFRADIMRQIGDLDELVEGLKPSECEDCGARITDAVIDDYETVCGACQAQRETGRNESNGI